MYFNFLLYPSLKEHWFKLLCSNAYSHESVYITLWITPKLAVAVNFAQLVALANHSKLSL